MKKIEYIDQLYFRLGTNDSAGKHPMQLCEAYLDMAWNQILHDAFRNNISSLDFYGRWYDVTVEAVVGKSGNRYIELPVPIVQLPSISEGVRRLKFDNASIDNSWTFRPISNDEYFLARKQQSNSAYLSGIDYIVYYDKIELGGNYDYTTMGSEVINVLLVSPFKSYDSTDNIPIPSGQQDMFFKIATEYALGTPPVNLENRNNS